MKLLLEDTVYDVPSDLLIAWVNITPKLRDEFRGTWESYKKQKLEGRTPTAEELKSLVDTFLTDNHDWYYQLMFEAMMDFRETNVDDFEASYKTDMSADDLLEYAERDHVSSHVPIVKQPIRIPITPSDD